ncbi:MAG: metallophosphoesterase, partial [Victivallales bacterium]|nr:metallophosphoesterase [Victivallales bacterium]
DSPADGQVLATAGADFFWKVFCNGNLCMDVFDNGNGGTPITAKDTPFVIPVHAGKNTIAFFVKSGRFGWTAAIDFPEPIPQNRNRLSRREQILNAFPHVLELRHGPWLTHARNGEVAVRFMTQSPLAVAVEYAPVGTEQWTRNYELWNGHYRRDTEYHAVVLDGLLPATEYQFRILLFPEDETDGGKLPLPLKKGHVLPTLYTFRSAPAPDAGFRFYSMSDTHLPCPSKLAMLQTFDKSYNFDKADFFAHIGDAASTYDFFDNELLEGFANYFNKNNRLQPICFAHGNHEFAGREAYLWNLCFSDPKTGLSYYAFRYGMAFFVVLDYWTERDTDTPPSNRQQHFRSQEEWALAVLQSEECKTATYRIILNHFPAQEPSTYETCLLCAKFFKKLFDTVPFHLVLCGHTHRYNHQVINGVNVVTHGGGERAHHLSLTQVELTPEVMHVSCGRFDGIVFEKFDVKPR